LDFLDGWIIGLGVAGLKDFKALRFGKGASRGRFFSRGGEEAGRNTFLNQTEFLSHPEIQSALSF
jgi:hypothetical protein